MTVDIVLATYNGEMFLQAQLDSILAQDDKDWRMLVRDDGSTDGTRALLAAYAKRHPRIVVLDEDGRKLGAIGNFSALLAESSAPYVMCCDQDDVWLPHKLSHSLAAMKKLEKRFGSDWPLLVHTDAMVTDAQLNKVHPSHAALHRLYPEQNSLARLLVQNTVQGCTMMVNCALLMKALPIPPQARMHDMWCALVAAGLGAVHYIPLPLVQYRQHGSNAVGAAVKSSGERAAAARKAMQENIAQAAVFAERYSNALLQQDAEMARALAALPTQNALMRRVTLLRYGLLRRPLWQNIGLLLTV